MSLPELFEVLRRFFESDDPADVVAAFMVTFVPDAPGVPRKDDPPTAVCELADSLRRDRASNEIAVFDFLLVAQPLWGPPGQPRTGFYGQSEWARVAAARRLARRWFTRRQVFDPRRWQAKGQLLADAFARRARERDRDEATAWEELVIPLILEGVESLEWETAADTQQRVTALKQGAQPPSPALTLDRMFQRLRAHVRKAVERDLLGHTLDEAIREGPTNPADPAFPDPPVPDDVIALADERLDLAGLLGHLTPRQRNVLWRKGIDDERGNAAFRQALKRARDRAQKFLKNSSD